MDARLLTASVACSTPPSRPDPRPRTPSRCSGGAQGYSEPSPTSGAGVRVMCKVVHVCSGAWSLTSHASPESLPMRRIRDRGMGLEGFVPMNVAGGSAPLSAQSEPCDQACRLWCAGRSPMMSIAGCARNSGALLFLSSTNHDRRNELQLSPVGMPGALIDLRILLADVACAISPLAFAASLHASPPRLTTSRGRYSRRSSPRALPPFPAVHVARARRRCPSCGLRGSGGDLQSGEGTVPRRGWDGWHGLHLVVCVCVCVGARGLRLNAIGRGWSGKLASFDASLGHAFHGAFQLGL